MSRATHILRFGGWITALFLFGAGVFWLALRSRESVSSSPTARIEGILVHCGNSMRPAAEDLAREFQAKHGIPVRFNFGGSAELLANIQLGQAGDLYLPHDPYARLLEEKGLLDFYEVVGHLEPVILVPPGNPRRIGSMADLAAPGVRVALPDARFATAGRLAREAFEGMGMAEAFASNVRMESRGHNDIALAVLGGQVDAGIVWNFIARHYRDSLEMVPTGARFPETRVTLCLLTHAPNREAALKFMEFAVSPAGRGIFNDHGYIRQPALGFNPPAGEPAVITPVR